MSAAVEESGPAMGGFCGQVRRGRCVGRRRRGRQLQAAASGLRGGARKRTERLRAVSTATAGPRVRPERTRGRHVAAAFCHVHRFRGRGARACGARLPVGRQRAAQRRQVAGHRVRAAAIVRVPSGRQRAGPDGLCGCAHMRRPRVRGLHARTTRPQPDAGQPQGSERVHRAARSLRVRTRRVRPAAGRSRRLRARQERQATDTRARGRPRAERRLHRPASAGRRRR